MNFKFLKCIVNLNWNGLNIKRENLQKQLFQSFSVTYPFLWGSNSENNYCKSFSVKLNPCKTLFSSINTINLLYKSLAFIPLTSKIKLKLNYNQNFQSNFYNFLINKFQFTVLRFLSNRSNFIECCCLF